MKFENPCKYDVVPAAELPLTLIPNIVTPNNDGINDVFQITVSEKTYMLSVYNSWGRLIFKEQNSAAWNCIANGEGVSDGIYFYIIETGTYTYRGYLHVSR